MELLTLIPARGGSKGIPNKNIKMMAGKPMIGWTIDAARQAKSTQRIIVSTDDTSIAKIAKSLGAEVPFMRPAEYAKDTSITLEVVLHALDWLNREQEYSPDAILLLQPTSPLRTAEDIDQAVHLYIEKNASAVVGVCAVQHPVEWMKRIGAEGELLPGLTEQTILRRQDGDPLYQLNGALYVISPPVLIRERTFMPERTFAYIMPPERSLDIDSPWEFTMAEALLKERYDSATD